MTGLSSDSQAGLVESSQGRGGESRLALPAKEITLRDAVEAAEGPFSVTQCVIEDRACGDGVPCTLHEAWEEGQQAILEYLGNQNLDEFVSQTASRKFCL